MTDDTPRGERPIHVRAPHDISDFAQGRGRPPLSTGRQRWVVGSLLGGFILLVFLGPAVIHRLADWLWFREIGYERVFFTKLVAQWTLGLIAGLGGFALLYGNARIALRGVQGGRDPIAELIRGGPAMQSAAMTRLAEILALPVSALFAFLMALVASSQWQSLAQFYFRQPFGQTDPVFQRDISYYVFTLPVIETALDFASMAFLLSLAGIAIPIYLARGEIGRRMQGIRVEPTAQWHVGILAGLFLVVSGLRNLLVDVPGLLTAVRPGSPLQGASYTDLAVRLPMLRVAGIVAIAGGMYLIWSARNNRVLRGAAVAFGGYIGATLLLLGLAPAAVQRLIVQPNELAREAPQIRHHIAATRHAWGIANVERRDLAAESGLTLRDIEAHQATISNVRLWDREPLLQTFGQIQSIRTYYDFVAVDDDRYRINGELRQVMLSVRELNTSALPTRTFINEHLTFTHGMGVTLGPTNQVTPEGLPVLWIKDLPPSSSIPIRVTRPQIYFGELSNEFVLAPSHQREFDYPAGEGDMAVYTTYTGQAGVPVASFPRRLLYAMRFRSLNILLSRAIAPETKIIYNRNMRERAQAALPFLRFDRDPYLVISDEGQLKWILDAYTHTSRYPYAQRLTDRTNYMRNSVKVVIDAYDGDVTAYMADPSDPIVHTLASIYPGILRPLDEMPADLRSHIRVPEDLFRIQSSLYATFHMSEPETFYHREDQWQVPVTRQAGQGDAAFMRHMVMRLPGEPEPEFILMRPFTPRQKDNLAAWMVARNDGDNYGKLVAYRFPRQSLVFGPAQVVNRINQDTEVARQISLWDQGGSQVIRGELLVIPIEESLIYVQPLYLRAQGGRIPELKRVIAVYENQVAMEETLERSLRRLFAGDAGAPVAAAAAAAPGAAPTTPDVAGPRTVGASEELLRRAVQHYERARAAQRNDDWTTYGTEMRALGEVLQQLQRPR